MVSYDGEQNIHLNTVKSLNIGIPAAATALGFLLFQGGFQLIKDWYLSEGGHEGPRKIWGEKAPDEVWARVFYQKTAQQIHQFLERIDHLTHQELVESALERSKEIMEIISNQSKSNE
jgi:hypothetical protein